jgi:hypothetical protein
MKRFLITAAVGLLGFGGLALSPAEARADFGRHHDRECRVRCRECGCVVCACRHRHHKVCRPHRTLYATPYSAPLAVPVVPGTPFPYVTPYRPY